MIINPGHLWALDAEDVKLLWNNGSRENVIGRQGYVERMEKRAQWHGVTDDR